MKRVFVVFLLSLLAYSTGYSQEILTALQINPAVKAGALMHAADRPMPGNDLPVLLPFRDDFSVNGVFPSTARWADRYAFVNDDLPVFPVDRGVVTLDAINDTGSMYPNAVPGPMSFIADHLTSRAIRLDSVFTPVPRKLTPADSVYLSFYYQPQGRGLAPQKNDSLILEFLEVPAHDSILPNDTIAIPDRWRQIWYSNGMSLDTFYVKQNAWFARVMIPVTDTIFFKDYFRFRFYNYISLASSSEPSWQSNTGQWNLDEIYLNSGRSQTDTVMPGLRFVYRPPSLLRRYQSMPYPQYCNDPTNEIADSLDVVMTNRDILPHMAKYRYTVSAESGSFERTYDAGNYNMLPYREEPYVTYPPFAHPPFPYLIPVGQGDSAVFRVTHMLAPVEAGSVGGDTMAALQKFYNYFAYDDGTPEVSYGLTPAGSKLAYRFRLSKSPDTLRAISIYFNRTLSNASVQQFWLTVWNDNAGKPGEEIYSKLVWPFYSDSLNHFVTYHMDPPLAIAGTFYIGCVQTTGDNLSIGFDRYNDSREEIMFNITGTWMVSSYTGSLMIRPIIGKPIPLGNDEKVAVNPGIRVFPNPATGNSVAVSVTDMPEQQTRGAVITITDVAGRICRVQSFGKIVDIGNLPAGLYFLSVRDRSGGPLGVVRFMVAR
ncbi:MAG TPA: T9SS type A sorting domain-containing protein [Bacteroidales bacterium]|nr:T9SS type A sorting domain-containing protein [Bacteroidales bacterium]